MKKLKPCIKCSRTEWSDTYYHLWEMQKGLFIKCGFCGYEHNINK